MIKNPMEHLKQWHNLYRTILTPSEVALYIELFMVSNSRFWPKEIELTDSQLSLGTNIGIKRIPTVINALVQKDLVSAERGKGKFPSRYRILPITYYTQTGVINREINERKAGDKREISERKTGDKLEINERLEENSRCESKAGEAPKTKTKTKTKTYKKAAANARAREEKISDEDFAEVCSLFSDNIHPVANEIEKGMLESFLADYGREAVLKAIRESALSGGRSVRYIGAILERWKRKWTSAPKTRGVNDNGRSTGGSIRNMGTTQTSDYENADRNQRHPWDVQSDTGGVGAQQEPHSSG